LHTVTPRTSGVLGSSSPAALGAIVSTQGKITIAKLLMGIYHQKYFHGIPSWLPLVDLLSPFFTLCQGDKGVYDPRYQVLSCDVILGTNAFQSRRMGIKLSPNQTPRDFINI
jgi:hypothetical protein